MPTVKTRTVLAAGVPVNIMANSQYRQPQFDARVRVMAVSDPADTVLAQVFSGSDLILEQAQLDEQAATIPLANNTQFLTNDVIQAGEQLGVIIQSATAGDIARVEVHLDPLV